MLTLPEKILFIIAVGISLIFTWRGVRRIIAQIARGQGKVNWGLARQRLWGVLARMVTFQPVFRFRFWPSLFHAFVGWGFGFYMLVNVVDVIRAYVPAFEIPGMVGNVYRLIADLLSIGVLVGILFFVIRRFIFRPSNLTSP
jgi:hypothetical protein